MSTNLQEKKTGMTNGSQMRITEQDTALMRTTFKDNEPLLLLLRKIFLPELDPNVAIGQMIDLWMTVDTKEMTPEDAFIRLIARNQLISHVDNCLNTIKLNALKVEETEAEKIAKTKKNSSK
jgi:hypothetical protein